MKLTFKQGIVKSQVDSNNVPTFLNKSSTSDYVSLYINATSTLITFSHGSVDYLYEESNSVEQAWGPFTPPVTQTYYLYWDIDLETGIRTFGHTTFTTVVSETPPTILANGQHWFNLLDKKMYVYQDLGWAEKIRVFAGVYANGSLTPYSVLDTSVTPSVTRYFTTQVGLHETANAGFILFDDNTLPIRRSQNSTFLTTESQFYTTKSLISAVNFDTNLFYATANENVPAFSIVSYNKDNTLSVASYDDVHATSANGFIRNEVYKGEVTNIVTNGYITNINWRFSVPAATPVYLGLNGEIQLTPPRSGFIQKVGTIVSPDTIFVNIEPQIVYNTVNHTSTSIPVNVDILTGKLFTAQSADADFKLPIPDINTPTPEPSASTLVGLTFIQHVDRRVWTITHGKNTENAFVQTYDIDGNLMSPLSVVTEFNTIIITFSAPVRGYVQAVLFLTPNYVNIRDNTGPTITEFSQTTPSVTWTVDHNLGHNPITKVYINNIMVLPSSIVHTSIDSVVITFSTPQEGVVRFI
jgi:hypothetical protein